MGVGPHPEFPNVHSEYGVWRPLIVLPLFANDIITIQQDYLLFGDCGAMGTSRPTAEGLFFCGAMRTSRPTAGRLEFWMVGIGEGER